MTINYKRQMLDDMAYGIILFYYILYAILIYILFYFGKAFYTSESYIGIIGIFYLRCHGYFIACTYFHSLVFMLLFFMKFIVNQGFSSSNIKDSDGARSIDFMSFFKISFSLYVSLLILLSFFALFIPSIIYRYYPPHLTTGQKGDRLLK